MLQFLSSITGTLFIFSKKRTLDDTIVWLEEEFNGTGKLANRVMSKTLETEMQRKRDRKD